ncbi:hypothetical protein FRC11_002860 [Ceratobasidium sp. 423]|nr:hypothetical protein FRC11_002860 [Ceratobasidium sp. 423]
MPKRSSNANASSQRAGRASTRKRVKKEESDDNSNNFSNATENDTTPVTHDPNYYFEDGSVTLRIRHILFKVTALVTMAL